MISRLTFSAALLALLLGGTAVRAESSGPTPEQAPSPGHESDHGFAGGLTKFKGALGTHGVSVRMDAALYDQWASETVTGPSNLATLTWQLSGRWQLPKLSRWGSGGLGWSLLGSQGIGNGSAGETVSDDVGSISGLNANVVPNVAAVDELFWRQEDSNRRWTLLVGRVDQAGHFDANRVANDGYGQFLAFALENNLSIPWSTYGGFGGVLRVDLGADRYLLASVAAVNDNPRVPWSAAGHEGVSQMLEIGSAHFVPGLGRGHARLTPWHSSIPGANGFGVAVNLDQEIGGWQTGYGPDGQRVPRGRLIGFFRAGLGEPAVTPVQAFVSGGAAVEGPFGRAQDRMAVGVAWSDPSPGAGERSETLIEAYYRFALSPALSLTPDLQLVIDPAMDPSADTALVVGLRLHLRY